MICEQATFFTVIVTEAERDALVTAIEEAWEALPKGRLFPLLDLADALKPIPGAK